MILTTPHESITFKCDNQMECEDWLTSIGESYRRTKNQSLEQSTRTESDIRFINFCEGKIDSLSKDKTNKHQERHIRVPFI